MYPVIKQNVRAVSTSTREIKRVFRGVTLMRVCPCPCVWWGYEWERERRPETLILLCHRRRKPRRNSRCIIVFECSPLRFYSLTVYAHTNWDNGGSSCKSNKNKNIVLFVQLLLLFLSLVGASPHVCLVLILSFIKSYNVQKQKFWRTGLKTFSFA